MSASDCGAVLVFLALVILWVIEETSEKPKS